MKLHGLWMLITCCGLMLLVVAQWANGEDSLPLPAVDETLLAQTLPVPPPETPPLFPAPESESETSRADAEWEEEEDDPEAREKHRKEFARIERERLASEASERAHLGAAKTHLRRIVAEFEAGQRPQKELKLAFARSTLNLFWFREQQLAARHARERFLTIVDKRRTDEDTKPTRAAAEAQHLLD